MSNYVKKYVNMYQRCEHCGQYINTHFLDHIQAIDSEQHIYLHINPCRRQYEGSERITEEATIRNHKGVA